jgi:hypothetical protein
MRPKRLFKYLPSQFVDGMTRKGRVLFRNLTYFRQYEDGDTRGDYLEGRHVDRPGSGVQLRNMSTGRTIEGDFAFINSVGTEGVFALCLSTKLDDELFSRFEADSCVEITSPTKFIQDCRRAIRKDRALAQSKLMAEAVEYYSEKKEANRSVKNPKLLPFFKPKRYQYQHEFRIVIAQPGSLELIQRIVQGSAIPETESPSEESSAEHFLRIGPRKQYFKVHARK